ncbi:polyprenyl synthetase family protein, partial [Chlamydia psittaci 06-1683]
MVFMD